MIRTLYSIFSCSSQKSAQKTKTKKYATISNITKTKIAFTTISLIAVQAIFNLTASAQEGEPVLTSEGAAIAVPTITEPSQETMVTAKPAIAGEAPNNSIVEIYVDELLVGNAKTQSAADKQMGSYRWDTLSPLSPGVHAMKVRAVDIETQEVSEFSKYTSFWILPFTAPTLRMPKSGIQTAPIKSVEGVTLNNSTVHLLVDGVIKNSITVGEDESGSVGFILSLPEPIAYGEHKLYLQAIDQTGRASLPSNVVTLSFPNISAPSIVTPRTVVILTDEKPTITGVAFNDYIVEVYVNGKKDGVAALVNHESGVGHFSYTLSTSLKREVENVITTVAKNKEGLSSNHSQPVKMIIEEYFIAPTLMSVAGQGPTPVVSGVAHNNSTIKIFVDQQLNTTITPQNHISGTLSFFAELETPLSYGDHVIAAVAYDPNGKQSRASNELSYTYSSPSALTPAISATAERQKQSEQPDTSTKPDGKTSEKPTSQPKDEVEIPILDEVEPIEKPETKGTISIEKGEGGIIKTDDEEESKVDVEIEPIEGAEEGAVPEKEATEDDETTKEPKEDSDYAAVVTPAEPNWPLIIGLIILIGLAILFIIWYLGQKRKLLNEGIDKLFSDEEDEISMETGETTLSDDKKQDSAKKQEEKNMKIENITEKDSDIPPPPPAI